MMEDECTQEVQEKAAWGPWGRLVATHPEASNVELIKEEFTIGRRRTCDKVLEDKKISGLHCRIYKVDDGKMRTVYIQDLRWVVVFVLRVCIVCLYCVFVL
jgi:hypothetical protein